METSLLSDTLTTLTTKHIHKFQIHSLIIPKDAIAPPLTKPRTVPKKLARKRCRIKPPSKIDSGDGGGGYDGESGGGFFDGGDGPFGGGGGGYGGGGYGWGDDGVVPVGPTDPAFDFVYEVLCWFVLSNCLHFAFKKVIKAILAYGEREKVSMRFIPIC